MDADWRNCFQDMDADIYSSVFGKSKTMKSQKVKAYAVYKQFNEETKSSDNLVIAANDTNEISVLFNGRSDCKVFPFDKVLYNDVSQMELYDSLAKSAIQDLLMGLNDCFIVCNLAFASASKSFEDNTSAFGMASVKIFVQNVVKELLLHMKNEENMDTSLHASFFEAHDNRIVDFLSSCNEFKELQIFKIPEQNYIEIKDLVEWPIFDVKDIYEIFRMHQHSFFCNGSICFCILNLSLVRKKVSSDGFESIQVGKLRVVDFAKCNNILETSIFEDYVLKTSASTKSSTDDVLDILRPAFGGNAKTSIIVALSSQLYSPEKDLSILQFVSQAQKISNYPEVDVKLIIPSSLKEYSEEIQELQKDFSAIIKGTGTEIKVPVYRFFKNSISLENEKMKTLYSYLLSLTDSINAKKQTLIGVHAATELQEHEIKEVEGSLNKVKLELDNLKDGNNAKEKSSDKADEIVTMMEMRNNNEYDVKKLKLELTKTRRTYGELIGSIDSLKNGMLTLSCDIDSELISMKSSLDLLMTDMGNVLHECETLHEVLSKKINDLSCIDSLGKTWKDNAEKLLMKFSTFIEEKNRSFDSIKFKLYSIVPLHTYLSEIIELIQNNRNEKWTILSYFCQKVQVFCDTSFKILAEIVCQLDIIQNYYKTELKTMGSLISTISKTLKKYVTEVNNNLKISQQHFVEQEKNLTLMTDFVYFHHKFKKQFDSSLADIKNSLLALKQMCLSHNDASITKWNKISKDCLKNSQKHSDLKENLYLIHKQMSSYLDNLEQQTLNALSSIPLKEKTENVESRTQQLLHLHSEMKAVSDIACESNQKSVDKELQDVKEHMNLCKTNIEKHFGSYSLTIKGNSTSFLDNLRIMQHTFLNNKEELKENINILSSTVSSLTSVYNTYQSVSSNVLERSEGALKSSHFIIVDRNDTLPELDSLYLDEWKVSSSTPNVTEKKILNKEYEKEKMLSRIKSVIEQQMPEQASQKLNIGDLESEGKDRNSNTSTMSLPNLGTYQGVDSKAYRITGKKPSKLKFSKKHI